MDLDPNDPQAIAYVDLGGMFVLLNNGQTLPITNLFDCDGDECEPAEAVSVVAGADGLGWWSVPLEFADPEAVN